MNYYDISAFSAFVALCGHLPSLPGLLPATFAWRRTPLPLRRRAHVVVYGHFHITTAYRACGYGG